MENERDLREIDFKISEINAQIETEKSKKKNGMILMIISIFFLWPLLIVGGIMYSSANSKIQSLESLRNMLVIQRQSFFERHYEAER